MTHIPVLLKETIEYLNPEAGDIVLDGTLGAGGHSAEICKKIGESGLLVGIEQDEETLEKTRIKIQELGIKNIFLVNENFRNLDKVLENLKIEKVDAAIFDLGMSSMQLDKYKRGFSFQKDEPLIMNFKVELEPIDLTARQILNTWSKQDIFEILKNYGEERFAKRISENIEKRREEKDFETTFDLVEVIKESVPVGYTKRRLHFATKTFQALRIAVNDELNVLIDALSKVWDFLGNDGRLVVISFHSLEDRIVKNFFRDKKKAGKGDVLTKKPITASDEEIKENPRSRSAKLRAIVKT